VKGLEVGNIEAKRNSATKLEVVCQLRKNIKINKSILLQLEKYGVECPPLLSIHGKISEYVDVFCKNDIVIMKLTRQYGTFTH